LVQVINHHGGSAGTILDALHMAPFVDGSQPFARSQRLASVRAEATLRPAGSEPVRSAVESGRTTELVTGDGWTLRSVRWSEGGARVEVVATSDELAQAILASAVEGAAAELPADDP